MKKGAPAGSPLYPRIKFAFTDHPITTWAGTILLRLYFEYIGLRTQIESSLDSRFKKISNNRIQPVDVLLAWMFGVTMGANRFEHLTRYRQEPLLGRLLGLKRFPSPDTIRRLFLRFDYRAVTEISETLFRFSLSRIPWILTGHTLDLDSTVFQRYGEQEGSLKGYNPTKRGRPSHHPLIAFLSESRRLLWAVMRSGNAGTANGASGFLDQALTMLPSGHGISMLRADSGFFSKEFLAHLEDKQLPYIIVARLTRMVRTLVLSRIPAGAWRRVSAGVEVADICVSLPNWNGKTRRFVCMRQELSIRPNASGRKLFDLPDYTYHLMVTDLPYAAEMVIRMYAGRADSENRIKELKDDLGLGHFVLNSFDATDATFRMGCVLYNLLAGFRETVLPNRWFGRRLTAIRDHVLRVGADLIPKANTLVIRFAVPRGDRAEFIRRLSTLTEGMPIAAQLEWDLTEPENEPYAHPEDSLNRLPKPPPPAILAGQT